MIGEVDREVRLRTFDWLTRQREEFGETLARTALEAFKQPRQLDLAIGSS